jgi:hypothetical protein
MVESFPEKAPNTNGRRMAIMPKMIVKVELIKIRFLNTRAYLT